MTVSIYDIARVSAATAAFNWNTDGWFATIPRAGYTVNVGTDTLVSVVGPTRGQVAIENPNVHEDGWCDCNPITFVTTPINSPIDHIVIYRASDGMLLIDIAFPAMQSPVSKPLLVIKGFARPGLFRL